MKMLKKRGKRWNFRQTSQNHALQCKRHTYAPAKEQEKKSLLVH